MAWYEFAACSRFHCRDILSRGPCLPSGLHRFTGCATLRMPTSLGAGVAYPAGYLIDQDEDRRGGDLNFCSYYHNYREMVARLSHFYKQANLSVSALPYARFHRLINQGLLGIYFADKKSLPAEGSQNGGQKTGFPGRRRGPVFLSYLLVVSAYGGQ